MEAASIWARQREPRTAASIRFALTPVPISNRETLNAWKHAAGAADRGEQRMELWRAPSFEEIIAAEKAKLGKAGTAR
jgi:hypothetical protein